MKGGLNRQGGRAEENGTWLFNPHHYKFDLSMMEMDHWPLRRHSGGRSPPERPSPCHSSPPVPPVAS